MYSGIGVCRKLILLFILLSEPFNLQAAEVGTQKTLPIDSQSCGPIEQNVPGEILQSSMTCGPIALSIGLRTSAGKYLVAGALKLSGKVATRAASTFIAGAGIAWTAVDIINFLSKYDPNLCKKDVHFKRKTLEVAKKENLELIKASEGRVDRDDVRNMSFHNIYKNPYFLKNLSCDKLKMDLSAKKTLRHRIRNKILIRQRYNPVFYNRFKKKKIPGTHGDKDRLMLKLTGKQKALRQLAQEGSCLPPFLQMQLACSIGQSVLFATEPTQKFIVSIRKTLNNSKRKRKLSPGPKVSTQSPPPGTVLHVQNLGVVIESSNLNLTTRKVAITGNDTLDLDLFLSKDKGAYIYSSTGVKYQVMDVDTERGAYSFVSDAGVWHFFKYKKIKKVNILIQRKTGKNHRIEVNYPMNFSRDRIEESTKGLTEELNSLPPRSLNSVREVHIINGFYTGGTAGRRRMNLNSTLFPKEPTLSTAYQRGEIISHEFGHLIGERMKKANEKYFIPPNWRRAMDRDNRSGVSEYANKDPGEDFAETFKVFTTFWRSGQLSVFRKEFPNRTRVLERAFNKDLKDAVEAKKGGKVKEIVLTASGLFVLGLDGTTFFVPSSDVASI